MPADPYRAAQDAAAFVAKATGQDHQVGMVLGSGWGPAADQLGEASVALPMDDVPGFTVPSIPGHAGVVSSIDCSGRRVLVLAGRSHLYEGHSPAAVVHGVRTAVLAGCRVLILTNAAGSLRPDWRVGQPVLIADHLNLTGHSPLVGPPPPEGFPPRFADLTTAYSPRLRAAARDLDPTLAEGVYAALLGGSYETPAEIQMLRGAGADLVGMSTALETIAAVHLGAEVLGVSLVTNLAAGLSAGPIDHGEVLAAGAGAAEALGRLLRSVIQRV